MPPLFTIPADLNPPASNAQLLYDQHRLEETVAFSQKELVLLQKQIPTKSIKLPQQDIATAPYQYFALTLILVDALAELGRWEAAKEALGKYRVHFPRDPWGFVAGALVTRRDPEVQDRAAVQRAVELLEGEARRLEGQQKVKPARSK